MASTSILLIFSTFKIFRWGNLAQRYSSMCEPDRDRPCMLRTFSAKPQLCGIQNMHANLLPAFILIPHVGTYRTHFDMPDVYDSVRS